jgi:CHASE2 domain-containing sensor protein
VRLQLWRAWDFCRTLLIGGASFAFGMIYLLPRSEGWAVGLIVLGLCCVGFLAVFVWNRFFPPAFQVDVHSAYVEYEFRDGALAREFAELNGARPAKESAEG